MYAKLVIVGKLGREPETRYVPDGTGVCNFSVATSNSYKNGAGQKVQETTWFEVAAWRRQAETCQQFLHKGSLVMVEGVLTGTKVDKGTDNYGIKKTINPRIWTGEDGVPRCRFEMKALSVKFLSRSGNGGGGYTPPTEQDEIPF